MSKLKYIVAVLILLVITLGLAKKFFRESRPKQAQSPTAAFPSSSPTPTEISTQSATFLNFSGTVLVTHDSSTQPATQDTELITGDSIETKADSQATIILANSSYLRLSENTNIVISQLNEQGSSWKVTIDQLFGQTWNRVQKLLGQNVDYEVTTPTAVATVRGTAFAVDANSESSKITVEDGTVSTKLVERTNLNVTSLYETNTLAGQEIESNKEIINTVKKAISQKQSPQSLFKPKTINKQTVSRWVKTNIEKDKSLLPIIKDIQPIIENPQQLKKVVKILKKLDEKGLISPQEKQEIKSALQEIRPVLMPSLIPSIYSKPTPTLIPTKSYLQPIDSDIKIYPTPTPAPATQLQFQDTTFKPSPTPALRPSPTLTPSFTFNKTL